MISPELIRRYHLFGGLSHEQILKLAEIAEQLTVEAGHYFFREGEELTRFYMPMQGKVGIGVELPEVPIGHPDHDQAAAQTSTRFQVLSTAGPGELFGWSGLIPPHTTTATAKALTSCRVICFDCRALVGMFADDCRFAYLMMQKAAQVIRDRLRERRTEALLLVASVANTT